MRKLIALFAVSMIVLSSCQSKPAEDAASQPAAETTNKLHNHSNRLPLLVKTKTPLTKLLSKNT